MIVSYLVYIHFFSFIKITLQLTHHLRSTSLITGYDALLSPAVSLIVTCKRTTHRDATVTRLDRKSFIKSNEKIVYIFLRIILYQTLCT
jgi:hypothetical protein